MSCSSFAWNENQASEHGHTHFGPLLVHKLRSALTLPEVFCESITSSENKNQFERQAERLNVCMVYVSTQLKISPILYLTKVTEQDLCI